MVDSALLQALYNPTLYPEPTTAVEVRETHISMVFLTDRYAYKVKKPLNLGFVDYSTLERRHFYCLQELLLNRRLSTGVYLDVVALHRNGAQYNFAAQGPVVEYVLKMRRLPADSTLQARLGQHTVTPAVMGDIAQHVANFHGVHAPPGVERQFGTLAQVQHDWQENFSQTVDCIGRTLAASTQAQIQEAVRTFMTQHAAWFVQRVCAKRIRDCHGDLRAEHIYLEPHQVQIIDCIEFNARLRYIDVASEVAFLAMDLERLGFPTLAHAFVRAYVRYSADLTLYRLLDFYRCYRAYVRGKVASIRLHEAPPPQERPRLQHEAEACFTLAARYASRCTRPLLIITTGLIGSGKSRVAEGVAAALDLSVWSSDRIRKEQAGLQPDAPQRVPYGTGIYSTAASRRTYEALASLARQALTHGQSVILDASFARQAERQRLATLAHEACADFFVIECVAPEAVLRERLEQRTRVPGTISDGRSDILPQFQRQYEPVQAGEYAHHVRLDTTQPSECCVQQALAAVQEGRS
jgi:aminoglycoside phosphotransferase family enzyme/predicted kinase